MTPAPRHGLRILLVDDSPEVRTVVRLGLQLDDRFAEITEASNGAEAIVAATTAPPDAILLDATMPVMTGVEALPTLRATAPAARIILYSAVANEIDPRAVVDADACVPKATDLCELYDLLAAPHVQSLAS